MAEVKHQESFLAHGHKLGTPLLGCHGRELGTFHCSWSVLHLTDDLMYFSERSTAEVLPNSESHLSILVGDFAPRRIHKLPHFAPTLTVARQYLRRHCAKCMHLFDLPGIAEEGFVEEQ